MTTEMISLSEYRKNISKLHQKSKTEKISYIVTIHGEPAWSVTPIEKKDINIQTKYSQDFIDELAEMERDYEAGNFVSFDDSKDMRKYFDKFL